MISYPMSYAQQRICFLDMYIDDKSAYNINMALQFDGILNVKKLENSIRTLVARHEILRTTFTAENDVMLQHISPDVVIDLNLEKADVLPAGDAEDIVNDFIARHKNYQFDLSSGPLLKFHLLQLQPDKWVMLVVMHHIIADAWSLGIIIRELSAIYRSDITDETADLPDLPVQYLDYSEWQRGLLTDDRLARLLSYWKEQLKGAPSQLALPADYDRPAVQQYKGATTVVMLDRELSQKLKALGQACGVSMYMMFLGVYVVLLSRYTGEEDIVIGTPVSTRNRKEIEGVIGFFLNSLVLRLNADRHQSFTALLQHVKKIMADAYDHQDMPFEKLVEAVSGIRNNAYTALFQVLYVYQEALALEDLQLPGIAVKPVFVESNTSKFDLSLFAEDTADGFKIKWEYRTDLFRQATIERLSAHFKNLVASVVGDPTVAVKDLDMLAAREKRELVYGLNDTAADYPQKTVVTLFEEQAARTPDQAAIVFGNETCTYRQLNDNANRLAAYLRKQGVGPNVMTGIYMERSPALVETILAIQKAGGVYVPLDPLLPAERLSYLTGNSNIDIVLNGEEVAGNKFPGIRIISLQENADIIAREDSRNLQVPLSMADNVYVMYTSGSTGTPKGIPMNHLALSNLLHWQINEPTFAWHARVAQCTPVGFDVSFQEIFSTLLSAGTLVIVPAEVRADTEMFLGFLEKHEVTRIFLPYVALRQLAYTAEQLPALRLKFREVITAGEQLHIDDAIRNFFSNICPESILINQYGPTEAHVVSSYTLSGNPSGWPVLPLIGKPIRNVRLYILDNELSPVPFNVTGELYIAGCCLSPGYLGHAGLTESRFIDDPFKEGDRMYRTGDLAKYVADGSIMYIGRNDQQVKIRGYRVEPYEIEHVLQQYEAIKAAAVIAPKDKEGTRKLIACVECSEKLNVEALISYLAQKLPDYMIPAGVVQLDKLPLTASGKVNKAALLDNHSTVSEHVGEYAPPMDDIEQELAAIWKDILDIDRVSTEDNFFKLGGHSLAATRLLNRIYKIFEVKLALKDIFAGSRLREQAALIKNANRTVRAKIKPIAKQSCYPLSFSQRQLWMVSKNNAGNTAYNISGAFLLTGTLDINSLNAAFRTIIARHEILRTVFKPDNEGLVKQYVCLPEHMPFSVSYNDRQDEDCSEEVLKEILHRESGYSFDLAAGPLLKCSLFRLTHDTWMLSCVMHHIIGDGWSMNILIRELLLLYQAYNKGESDLLAPLPVQYADYSDWQQRLLAGAHLDKLLQYWKQQLSGAPPFLPLPTDHERPPVHTYKGATEIFVLDDKLTRALRNLCDTSGTTLYMALLGVYAVLLSRYSGTGDIVVGSPVANRSEKEIEALVGCFVNTVPLRVRPDGNLSFSAFLNDVKERVLAAYEHQDLPFDQLVEAVNPPRDVSYTPIFQVFFAIQDGREKMQLADMEVIPVRLDPETSKFDLSLFAEDTANGLTLRWEYSKDLFCRSTILRLCRHFEQLLISATGNPGTLIGKMQMLTSAEAHQLLYDFNKPADKIGFTDASPNALSAFTGPSGSRPFETATQMIKKQVARQPDATAVRFGNTSVSYEALDRRSDTIAYFLQRSFSPGSVVGVLMERCIETVVVLLGILKSGMTYLPLDNEHPAGRINLMLEETKCNIVFSNIPGPDIKPATVIDPATIQEQRSKTGQAVSHTPEETAYIIYTSGSTGKPKGVAITQANMASFICSCISIFEGEPFDTVFASTSLCFDLSVFEIFYSLAAGKTIRLLRSPFDIPDYLCSDNNILLNMVPSVFEEMLSHTVDLSHVRLLNLAGEPVSKKLLETLSGLDMVVRNFYGPSETTTYSTEYLFRADFSKSLIGKPLANTTIYILDTEQRLQPIGVPGEIYIGGTGVSKGYVGNATLTAEKFIENALNENERLYRTGDFGKWLADGNIEYLGRIDQQVKIRGFRIELGEIETHIARFTPYIKQAVVQAAEVNGEKLLAAYYAAEPGSDIDKAELQEYLHTRLPGYMVPRFFVEIDRIPLTPNGKIDRKALPGITGGDLIREVYVGPRNGVEEKLAEIWQEVLKIEKAGVTDNFFELGGHSLQIIKVNHLIHKTFGVSLRIDHFFEHSTIEKMSELLTTILNTGSEYAGTEDTEEIVI